MHDPKTLARAIRLFGIDLLDIWHVDPEVGGDDNSCDWHGSRLGETLAEDIEQLPEEVQQAVRFIWWQWHRKLRPRPWWKHPKWHIHHWEIQSPILHRAKRWLWSRCQYCGKGFSWHQCAGRVVNTGGWGSSGRPGWSGSEEKIAHFECYEGRRGGE